jgi:molecular chaperone DnaJ
MPKNYYLILGVSPKANQDKIRKAYRSVAKKYHPDAGGSDANTHKFLEVKEAFDVLSDKTKRRLYDAERISKTPVDHSRSKFSSSSPRCYQSYPSHDFYEQRLSLIKESLFDDFFADSFYRQPQKRHHSNITLDILLSATEAHTGGVFLLSIPIEEKCRRCGARGHARGFICHACQGHGHVMSEQKISLKLPPDIRHGTKASISLDSIGLKGIKLFLSIHIDK